MRRLPPHLAPLGYSPRRYKPLSPAPVLGMAERLMDLLEMQLLFANGENGGYWPADTAYAYEDSAGTTLASVDGVVGYRTDVALGKHAVQSTTANKPYLRLTPTTNKPWYDSNTATGAMNATFASALGSACTIATVTPEGVSILENQTVGTTYNITPPYGYNSDVLVINRALTAAEKALVTRVMQRSVPALGSELVTNGWFDVDTTGWTPYHATTAIVNSRLIVTATDLGPLIRQDFSTSPSVPIYLSFDFYDKTITGSSFFYCGQSAGLPVSVLNYNLASVTGVRKMALINPAAKTSFTFAGSSSAVAGQTQTWDSITARHIL